MDSLVDLPRRHALFEALFGKKQKSHAEEAQLLLEEIRWGINHEQVELEQERTRRLEKQFEAMWERVRAKTLALALPLPLPEILATGPLPSGVAEEQRRDHELRLVFLEVWLADHGRCRYTQRDRGLVFARVATPDALARVESKTLDAVGGRGRKDDRKVADEAKKRRDQRQRDGDKRAARRWLAAHFAVVHPSARS